jgi:hypothetical protein
MIRTWKGRFLSILLIALGVAVLVTIFAPGAIAWYFNPPVEYGVNCTNAVRWGLGRLQLFQFIGLIVGFILGVVLTYFLSRNSRDSASPDETI